MNPELGKMWALSSKKLAGLLLGQCAGDKVFFYLKCFLKSFPLFMASYA
jgi:hypothetical protein